jgi:Fe-S-cluster containining protein
LSIDRLDPEGFIEIYSAEVVKGWVRLRDRRSPDGVADGACIFLDNNNQCSIYEARPLQCR